MYIDLIFNWTSNLKHLFTLLNKLLDKLNNWLEILHRLCWMQYLNYIYDTRMHFTQSVILLIYLYYIEFDYHQIKRQAFTHDMIPLYLSAWFVNDMSISTFLFCRLPTCIRHARRYKSFQPFIKIHRSSENRLYIRDFNKEKYIYRRHGEFCEL